MKTGHAMNARLHASLFLANGLSESLIFDAMHKRKPTVTITLPEATLKRVRRLAKMNARSLSNQMARLVEAGLDRPQPNNNDEK